MGGAEEVIVACSEDGGHAGGEGKSKFQCFRYVIGLKWLSLTVERSWMPREQLEKEGERNSE